MSSNLKPNTTKTMGKKNYLEGSTTNQKSINIGLSCQFFAVSSIYRTCKLVMFVRSETQCLFFWHATTSKLHTINIKGVKCMQEITSIDNSYRCSNFGTHIILKPFPQSSMNLRPNTQQTSYKRYKKEEVT